MGRWLRFLQSAPERSGPVGVRCAAAATAASRSRYSNIPEEALEAQQKVATDPMQQSFAGLMRCYAQGAAIDMEDTLKAFPVQLAPVREYARSVLGVA
jgi:hypothetical protein